MVVQTLRPPVRGSLDRVGLSCRYDRIRHVSSFDGTARDCPGAGGPAATTTETGSKNALQPQPFFGGTDKTVCLPGPFPVVSGLSLAGVVRVHVPWVRRVVWSRNLGVAGCWPVPAQKWHLFFFFFCCCCCGVVFSPKHLSRPLGCRTPRRSLQVFQVQVVEAQVFVVEAPPQVAPSPLQLRLVLAVPDQRYGLLVFPFLRLFILLG